MWKNRNLNDSFDRKYLKNFENFKKKKLKGKPLGKSLPKVI